MSLFGTQPRTLPDYSHPINRGLILWYPLWEMGGTKAYDLSTKRYTGTLSGSPAWSGSKAGYGILFDGTNDYIDTGKDTEFNFATTTFSVAGYFRTNSVSGIYLFGKMGTTNVGGWGVGVGISAASKFSVIVKNTGLSSNCMIRDSSSSVNDNVWHSFVVVITTDAVTSGNNTATIYIDGKVDQSSVTLSGVSNGTATSNLFIGQRTSGNFFAGAAYGLRVYNRALTGLEAQQLHTNPDLGLYEEPFAYVAATGGTATNRQYSMVFG